MQTTEKGEYEICRGRDDFPIEIAGGRNAVETARLATLSAKGASTLPNRMTT
jgi:hypothetical protein